MEGALSTSNDAGLFLPSITLETLLAEYVKPEIVKEWKCKECGHRGGVRSANFTRLPNVLVIHIERQSGVGLFSKLNRKIQVPDTLEMTQFRAKIAPGGSSRDHVYR